MSKPSHVSLILNAHAVRPSKDPKRPVCLSHTYEGPGKDQAKEGIEINLTREEATKLGLKLLQGANGEWNSRV